MCSHAGIDTAINRRSFLAGTAVGAFAAVTARGEEKTSPKKKAQIALTFDLEMTPMYPRRDMMEWDYEKGNLNQLTKDYSLEAARLANARGGVMYFFCVGRVLEQANVDWIKEIFQLGHPVGNHTYDHVNVWTTKPEDTQFRFARSPWLIQGKTAEKIIRENIRITSLAMKQRAGIEADGFRTPGGSYRALDGREDLQKMLLDEGFAWVSSKYPRHPFGKPHEAPSPDDYAGIVKSQEQAQPYVYPTGLIEIPMSPISDVYAFYKNSWKLEYFLKSIRQCVAWAVETGGVFDFLCHPSIMYVEDPSFETVKLFCELVEQAGDKAEMVGLSAIADRVQT